MSRVPLRAGLLSTIDGADEPHLLGSQCRACRQLVFPPASFCPYCSGDDCEIVPLSRDGTLYSYTAVEKAPPGYRGSVPYGFGVVELPEGLRVISRLTESRVERLSAGMPMRLVLEELFVDEAGNQVIGWAFAPGDAP